MRWVLSERLCKVCKYGKNMHAFLKVTKSIPVTWALIILKKMINLINYVLRSWNYHFTANLPSNVSSIGSPLSVIIGKPINNTWLYTQQRSKRKTDDCLHYSKITINKVTFHPSERTSLEDQSIIQLSSPIYFIHLLHYATYNPIFGP